jgi:myo-inositol-1(or 4)-monophosphatase
VAAGSLLVEEAGGRVSGIRGEPLELTEFVDIVSSNGLIHEEFIEVLGYRKQPLNLCESKCNYEE